MIIATCFFVSFITKGMAQVRLDFGFTDEATANIVLGIVYFCIIACDFFVNYRVLFRHKASAEAIAATGAENADQSADDTDTTAAENNGEASDNKEANV
jgi:ABC-type uncharacterized transport system permease subunit